MAYHTGSSTDMDSLRQALIDACVIDGWTWNIANEVLHKGNVYLNIPATSDGRWSIRGRTSLTAGDGPNVVGMGQWGSPVSGVYLITHPATYHIFIHIDEVYMVVNFDTDKHQWLAFGQSTVPNMTGTGMWYGGFRGTVTDRTISYNAAGSNQGSARCLPGLFNQLSFSPAASKNYWVHSDLDSSGWSLGLIESESQMVGGTYYQSLISALPNSWNTEAVLLPLQGYKRRPGSPVQHSLVADLKYARITRIDYYTPGQIIQIGLEKWMVFPWYLKNSDQRDGADGHTGTFGWAIKYEGP